MSYPFPPNLASASPWGAIQSLEPLGPDAVVVSTASHGGIRVSPAGLSRIPEPLQVTAYSAAGWFEEDCDWAIPYLALGLDAFETATERGAVRREAARRTLWAFHRAHADLLVDAAEATDLGGPADG